jgi:8-oxo-dGTP pyrophosphatase MutT (NUDIX family)
LILQHRDFSVSVRPGEACSSVSGTVDRDDADTLTHHPILRAIYREAREEIGLEEWEFGPIYFLGAVREFLRGGLPDLFFVTVSEFRRDEIVEVAEHSGKNRDRWEWETIWDEGMLPLPMAQCRATDFGGCLRGYVDFLSRLDQPPSLPLLTNVVLLAQFQSAHPEVFEK